MARTRHAPDSRPSERALQRRDVEHGHAEHGGERAIARRDIGPRPSPTKIDRFEISSDDDYIIKNFLFRGSPIDAYATLHPAVAKRAQAQVGDRTKLQHAIGPTLDACKANPKLADAMGRLGG